MPHKHSSCLFSKGWPLHTLSHGGYGIALLSMKLEVRFPATKVVSAIEGKERKKGKPVHQISSGGLN